MSTMRGRMCETVFAVTLPTKSAHPQRVGQRKPDARYERMYECHYESVSLSNPILYLLWSKSKCVLLVEDSQLTRKVMKKHIEAVWPGSEVEDGLYVALWYRRINCCVMCKGGGMSEWRRSDCSSRAFGSREGGWIIISASFWLVILWYVFRCSLTSFYWTITWVQRRKWLVSAWQPNSTLRKLLSSSCRNVIFICRGSIVHEA